MRKQKVTEMQICVNELEDAYECFYWSIKLLFVKTTGVYPCY